MMDDTRSETPDSPAEADPPSAASDEPAPPDAETAAEAVRERDEYRDLLLRKTAELDNYRKRVERERAAMTQTATADLVRELLPLVDNLERALGVDAEAGDAAAYRTGVELIRKQLLDLLAARQVAPIDTAGRQFDPHYHEAVVHEASDAHAEGQIIEEIQRGYVMAGRLLRPAMVKVAKG